jgi:hypothetical protein
MLEPAAWESVHEVILERHMKSNTSNQARLGGRIRNCLARFFTASVLLTILIGNGCSTEPVWKGRSLSAWLGDLKDVDQSRSDAAEEALKHIGTNAIPFLRERLASKPPAFGEALAEKQSEAVLAFRVLGISAAQALPALSVLLTNHAEVDLNPIAQSMAGIGEQAKPQLLVALNNPSPNVRRASLVGLIDLGKRARDVMPAVMERLRDEDAEVRGFALFFVSDVSDDRELKLRIFKEASRDSNRHVRSFAEKELSNLGVQ